MELSTRVRLVLGILVVGTAGAWYLAAPTSQARNVMPEALQGQWRHVAQDGLVIEI